MGSLVHMGLLPFLESLTFKFAETPQESAEEIETETYACYGYPTMTKTQGNLRLRVVEDFNEELQRPEAISKIDSSYCEGGVSKPVDDREDGGENRTSRVDAAAPPLSKCKRDYIAGTHVPCSERLRGQRCRNNPEVGNHELGKKCDKVVNDSADLASSRSRLREGPGDERGDSGVPVNKVSQLLPLPFPLRLPHRHLLT
ncbi:uncharacterized protein LOC131318442 [Rhododendron vialii]|uniref:uncharacterized protein LOC131318442 n=1 Tax=Rhododendron vialii TaxID=182163 RepID=UPI00265FCEE5|nr:uncharacterized protein LOC131318442 [Rhododendron vialii]XP_058204175.1 uncharacterized protein LOC131318442 [Rhododendron vialii]XP_058204176.1 uncharacterized protein LOC131318442 [Rhododendron vialii]XP_058204177.1 uncharacterized protein LOC131318442 [Rhododendron vialii]XP_058204179.1 uncharacterized protein LOC131318442 [Rhododendron vialii]XP_058204180.1 uncharacterized protein LOC131318442 [Rhododendron vialii]XP_058204181.1 uncharacterized protein LOC131318442 [Rhododendron viali